MTEASVKKVWSGFCNMGQCEGTRPKGYNGSPLKTCPFWQTCPCECHVTVTRMFEMSGADRIPVDNPEWVPYVRDFWMPSDDPNYAMPEATPVGETNTSDHLEVTPTGRTRKGSLESAVQRVVLGWLEGADLGKRIEGFAVKDISAKVYENEGAALEKPPSLGAVGAVLDRWEQYGYVLLGRKPVRVIGLTPEGTEKGLEWCRAKHKKQKAA